LMRIRLAIMNSSEQRKLRFKSLRLFSLSLILLSQTAPAAMAELADSHFRQAMKYEFSGQVDAAVAEYRRGLQNSPQSVDGHTRLGTLLLDEEGDVDGAISEFVTALSIDPDCGSCQARLDEAVARKKAGVKEGIARGNDFYRAGQLSRSIASYRIAVAADGQDSEARNCLAWTLYRVGKLDEALLEVNTALKLKPDEAEYVNTLACIQYDQGGTDAALSSFKKAIAKSKSPNPADLYGLAICYLAKGDKVNSIKNFKEALKSDNNYRNADYLRDKIGLSVHALATHEKLLDISSESAVNLGKPAEEEKSGTKKD
ncbi:MAG: tetratricopeptide repeat protein, partial [Candidatus Obscuribacterales bacterium]|nr:tetratricopeptide repeat protein [Candidatus Obscuribacterales bacterium]